MLELLQGVEFESDTAESVLGLLVLLDRGFGDGLEGEGLVAVADEEGDAFGAAAEDGEGFEGAEIQRRGLIGGVVVVHG